MTEKSYVWDALVTGDASLAPYNKDEFNTFLFSGSDGLLQPLGNVVPNYLDNLQVTQGTGVSFSLTVKSGAGMVKNHLFVSTEDVTVPIEPAASGYIRLDYIVLRLKTLDIIGYEDQPTHTVRIKVRQGTPAVSAPSAPTLVQNAYIWEVPVARVYVDGSQAGILDGDVRDLRNYVFAGSSGNMQNQIWNSDFMPASASSGSMSYPPEKWGFVEGTETWVFTGATDNQPSGRRAQLETNAVTGGGLRQYIPVIPEQTYTLKGELGAGASGAVDIDLYIKGYDAGGVESSVSYHQLFRMQNSEIEEYALSFSFPETDIVWLELQFWCSDNESFNIGQHLLVEGFYAGDFRKPLSLLPAEDNQTAAAWSDTAKSSGTTTLTDGTFSGLLRTARGIIVRIKARDSGSAAGSGIYLSVENYGGTNPYGKVDLDGVPNDEYRELFCVAPFWETDTIFAAGFALLMRVAASGAGTLDATVEIAGFIE